MHLQELKWLPNGKSFVVVVYWPHKFPIESKPMRVFCDFILELLPNAHIQTSLGAMCSLNASGTLAASSVGYRVSQGSIVIRGINAETQAIPETLWTASLHLFPNAQ